MHTAVTTCTPPLPHTPHAHCTPHHTIALHTLPAHNHVHSPPLTDSGEAHSDGSPLPNSAEHIGLAVLRDVMCHLKVAKGTCTSRQHNNTSQQHNITTTHQTTQHHNNITTPQHTTHTTYHTHTPYTPHPTHTTHTQHTPHTHTHTPYTCIHTSPDTFSHIGTHSLKHM